MPSPVLKLNKLFNAYNTTLRMLQDRGCTILGPQPVVEALKANPTGHTPVSLALIKKMSRPDAEDAQHNNITINRAALTITCTLSSYVLQLTHTTATNSQAALMQVVFVEESHLTMNTVNQCRDAARGAGVQWLTLVADARIPTLVRKEVDELNIGWTLLTSSAAGTTTAAAPTPANSKKGNGIVTDIVERNVAGLEIPEGAKPRRLAKKSAAAATEASAAAIQNTFVDENQTIASLVAVKPSAEDDSDSDNAKSSGKGGKKQQKEAKPRPLFVELFEEDNIVFSPLRHSMTPKHRVLSEAETEELLKEKGATLPQLPRMEYTDPIARYFGLQRGAVVHIQRAAHTDVVGEHSMYRHVV